MKPVQFTLHPSSALAGAFLLALCLITLGAFTPQGSSGARDVSAIQNVNDPSPGDSMTLFGDATYTVPSNKRFVLTSLGSVYPNNIDIYLYINGLPRTAVNGYVSYTGGSVKSIPDFVIAAPNSILTIGPADASTVATGYLIDA